MSSLFMSRRYAAEISASIRSTGVRVTGIDPVTGKTREIIGGLNFCRGDLVQPDQIGLSDEAFQDLGLPEDAPVIPGLAVAPQSL
jgi:hypothetical protein